MNRVRRPFAPALEQRLLAGRACNEDAAVLAIPQGKAIVQTTDVLAPIVNDARSFGRIAAANALSDVYAMGGQPWCAMSLAFFPPCLAEKDEENTLLNILEGSLEKIAEAEAVLAGGHTVQDEELKFGLAVTGIIDPDKIASNDGLRPGQTLLLTKPLGVGILATGVKAHWDYADQSEQEIIKWCSKLNIAGAEVIRRCNLTGATDITGFGLGGHALEIARASAVCIEIFASRLPLLPHALDYAQDGLIPAGTHANQKFCAKETIWPEDMDRALLSIVFDAQTSGGLLLAVSNDKLAQAREILLANGDLAAEVGFVQPERADGKRLVICQ